MTPQIKQRIEQIKNGEIPEGYKHSKVGIIPEDWKVLRLKDKFDRLSRKNAEGNTNVLTISAQYGLINQEEFFKKEIASDDKSNYYLLHRGEFAYNKSYSNGYPFGAIKRLSRYDKGVVSPLYICFSANSNNACPEYYEQYFEAGRLNHEIQAYAQEGARNHGLLNISVIDFFNSFILVPPIAEQKKIAKILSAQDKVIECYEKKIEQLKLMKKYYLQNMFPKRGETVPKIRFNGFTDPWEQRKFGDQYEKVTEKNDLSFGTDKIISVANMYFKSDVKQSDDDYMRTYNIMRLGDIAFEGNKSKRFAHGRFVENTIGNGIVSHVFDVFRPIADYDLLFWKYLINNEGIMGRILTRCTKASTMMTNLVATDFLAESILIPAINEQKIIGKYFKCIDNLINLHQRKLEEEKKKKKALQQLLLTGIVRTN